MVSEFFFKIVFNTYQRAGRLAKNVGHDSIPKSFPIQLRTGDFAPFAPGLVAKFGAERNMSVALALEQGMNISMTESAGLRLCGPAGMIFQVEENQTANTDAFALRLNLTLATTLAVVSDASGALALQPNFTAVSFPAKVANSTVGAVGVLPGLINWISWVVQTKGIPVLNAALQHGIPLPSSSQVRPANTSVAVRQGHIVIASDILLNITDELRPLHMEISRDAEE